MPAMSRGSCDGFVRDDYRSSVCRWRRNPQGRATRTGNIERLRADQKWTFAALSEQLGILGRPIPPLGLRKIVAEPRRVDVDDLVALAAALGVSPASLLMPELATVAETDLVPVSGGHKPISASVVWRWLTAAQPIVRGTLGTFVDRALPSWERERRLAEMGIADGDDK